MKRTADYISYFFLISCLLHGLLLWALDLRHELTERRAPTPILNLVFPQIALTVSCPAKATIAPQKARPKTQMEVATPLPQKDSALQDRETPPPEPVPAPIPANQPEPKPAGETAHSCPFLNAVLTSGKNPASSPGTPGPDSPVSKQNIFKGYLALIRELLEQNKDYPLWAQRNNWEGTVWLRFIVLQDGLVEDVKIMRPSGVGLLDEAAERTVRRIGRFPSIPKELAMGRLSLDVPLVFRLVNR